MVEVNGVRTHFQLTRSRQHTGPAPIVVCVHGLGYDSLASFYLTLAAPLSAAGVDVLAYDLRGHGRSERPRDGYQVADFVADLTSLLDILGIDRPVHLIGNSFGGTIAFSLAALESARVASVVSIESEPATTAWADRMRRTLGNVVNEMSAEENLAWLAETFGGHHARLAKAAGLIIQATSIITDVPRGPLLTSDDLRALTVPVLSIVGSEGFQRDNPHALQAALPNCTTEVIEGQNHSVLVERHHTVRELVLDWVAQHEPACGEAAGVA
ncbi:alpha/beta hydrolase [Haloechinothrix salitolerans]|uniref:Alpha/beta fold hydrolase n=1 Tax=Haloechinothrix salitolerans TaxID=926830 RepID=A0ABW2C8E9_9PSEU